MEKSKNLELVGASPTEWQLKTPRVGGVVWPDLPPSNRVKDAELMQDTIFWNVFTIDYNPLGVPQAKTRRRS